MKKLENLLTTLTKLILTIIYPFYPLFMVNNKEENIGDEVELND